ncbi:hypothetical protein AB0K00_08685 [Dactylosporangium sp. NPDC049525]|uniref:hypothetical protein n=1 Tax=Dactylosporangium sp. NPDC049525 TaxID=3154730 RepID=UPI00341B28E2
MIVGSLLLIVVAVGLLVVGLLQGADALLVASIGASLLAAVALIVGGRQAAAARSSRAGRIGQQVPSDERYDPFESRLDGDGGMAREARQPVGAGARSTGGTTYGRGGATRLGGSARSDANLPPADETAMMAPVRDEPRDEPREAAAPQQPDVPPFEEYPQAAAGEWSVDGEDYDDEDPEDEPPIQASSAADIARVSTMTDEVLVIDGRPRYHVRGCVHLLGRESEPLPIGEAVELGFTPCSVCEPNDVVLAGRG